MDIHTVYLYGLIIAGALTLIYLLFSDVFDSLVSIVDIAPGSILNPVVVLGFISIFSGTGYVLEMRESFGSVTNFIVASIISLILISIIQFFILIPLSKSEQSTAESITDLIGKDGEVITTIPVNGFGEILVSSLLGSTGNVATCIKGAEIMQGTTVLVIDVAKDGVLIVAPYKDGKII